jgi:hypothetical protein
MMLSTGGCGDVRTSTWSEPLELVLVASGGAVNPVVSVTGELEQAMNASVAHAA